jgi:hypothetical protein
VPLENLQELKAKANLDFNLRISRSLFKEILAQLSKMTYLYQLTPEQRTDLINLQNEISANVQHDLFIVSILFSHNEATKKEGLELSQKIRNAVPYDDFAFTIKRLFLKRKITAETAYFLDWQYYLLDAQVTELQTRLAQYKETTEQRMNESLLNLIRQDVITLQDDDYVVHLEKSQDVFKLNGKSIK